MSERSQGYRRLVARLAGLGLVAVVLQIALFSQLDMGGGNPDLAPLVVMSVGLLGGAMVAASFGFAVGLLIDVALLQTLGVTSLVLLAVGYWCGRARELHELEGALLPVAAGAAATLIALLGFSLMQFLLDVDPPLGMALARELLATVLLNALIALPVHAAVRRWLARGLPAAGAPRRRRAHTTGGLSPLSHSSEGPIVR